MYTININNKIYLKKYNSYISFLNDIVHKHDDYIYSMICEIPKNTNAKMEINLEERYNPIIQDIYKGKPRFYTDKMKWNYGAIPQTLEDDQHIFEEIGYPGDGDPIDVIDIGSRVLEVGEIIPVKIIGIIPLIDNMETDWKILAININDTKAKLINNLEDLNRYFPNLEIELFDWFENYKLKSHQIKNTFGLNKKIGDKELAKKIIELGHKHWKDTIKI